VRRGGEYMTRRVKVNCTTQHVLRRVARGAPMTNKPVQVGAGTTGMSHSFSANCKGASASGSICRGPTVAVVQNVTMSWREKEFGVLRTGE